MAKLDEFGDAGPGPSWKWIAIVLLSIFVPLGSACLVWIGSNIQTLAEEMPTVNFRIDASTKQLDEIRQQLVTMNTQLNVEETGQATLEIEFKQLSERLARVEDTADTSQDWISAQVLTSRSIHAAQAAKRAR